MPQNWQDHKKTFPWLRRSRPLKKRKGCISLERSTLFLHSKAVLALIPKLSKIWKYEFGNNSSGFLAHRDFKTWGSFFSCCIFLRGVQCGHYHGGWIFLVAEYFLHRHSHSLTLWFPYTNMSHFTREPSIAVFQYINVSVSENFSWGLPLKYVKRWVVIHSKSKCCLLGIKGVPWW